MKLVVMIPAFNEESTIADVIHSIPRDAVDDVKVLVVDDGSTDDTVYKSKEAGADKIISFKKNMGLGVAFEKGLEQALDMGGDIIVNIDADGQYDPNEIPKLIKPIKNGEADLVLGSRFKGSIQQMARSKRIGNMLATKVTSFLSGIPISDAQTGFRALSREAAIELNVISEYTYVQETIIQAANKGLKIVEVPCNFQIRIKGSSRLITNIFSYARKSGLTILRTYLNYRPLRTFVSIGGILFLIGMIIGLRVLFHFILTGRVSPYIPSAILTAVFLIVGFQIIVVGLFADMIGVERRLIEKMLSRLKEVELESNQNKNYHEIK